MGWARDACLSRLPEVKPRSAVYINTMNMQNLDYKIKNELDVLYFFQQVIAYRSDHKEDAAQIARYAYVQTHELKTGCTCTHEIEFLRGEMIALEAPGWPPEELNMEPEEHDDMLWNRLNTMIDVEIKKRTV